LQEQLDSGNYETEEEFAEDVRLVFTNTFTYNQPGSDIVVMASTLSSLFNEKFEILKTKIEERGRDAPEGMEESIKELRDSMSSVQRELERIKKTPNGRAGGQRGAPAASEDQRPMTFEEKKKLSHAINNLPSENLGMVVKIIHERMPQLTASEEEIEIDIDALNPATLRHLERYVRSVTQRGRRRGSRTPSLTSSAKNVQNEPLAPQGTQQKIEDVERQIKALTEHQQAITQKGLARSTGEPDLLLAAAEEKKKRRNNDDDSDSSESETDGSDTSDSSDSDTSDSESDSGSDSESTDSEADEKKDTNNNSTIASTTTADGSGGGGGGDPVAIQPSSAQAIIVSTDAAPVASANLPSTTLAGEVLASLPEATTATSDPAAVAVADEAAAASAPSPATEPATSSSGTEGRF
jgi:hypothetical protein